VNAETASVTRPCNDIRRSIAVLETSAQKPSGHRIVIVLIGSACVIVLVRVCMTESSMTV